MQFAKKMEIKEVIPKRLSFKIENGAPEDANNLLFLHLQSHSSLETLHKLCDMMISMSGYPNMNELGRSMKDALTTVSYVAESYEYRLKLAHVCVVFLAYYVQCVHTVHVTVYKVK